METIWCFFSSSLQNTQVALDKVPLPAAKAVLNRYRSHHVGVFRRFWCPQAAPLELVPVPAGSEEWQLVLSKLSGGHGKTIHVIQRVQNQPFASFFSLSA